MTHPINAIYNAINNNRGGLVAVGQVFNFARVSVLNASNLPAAYILPMAEHYTPSEFTDKYVDVQYQIAVILAISIAGNNINGDDFGTSVQILRDHITNTLKDLNFNGHAPQIISGNLLEITDNVLFWQDIYQINQPNII